MTALIHKEELNQQGITGVLFTPVDHHASAAVVVVGGSEGGMHERDAEVLAGEGFATLALAYFGAPGVPPVLSNIPLEYFFRANDLLETRGFPPGAIGYVGGSRGGEAALLVASHDQRIGGVVSVVGSGVVTEGIDYSQGRLDQIISATTNSWTLDGQPLPYLPYARDTTLAERVGRSETIPMRLAFQPVPDDPQMLERISIPVEQIRGAILLLSAGDDQMWDSAGYSEVAANRLRASKHPQPWDHIVFDDAGHPIAGPPGQPFTATTAEGPGVTFEMGGTPDRNTRARQDAWNRTVAFLREHLGAR